MSVCPYFKECKIKDSLDEKAKAFYCQNEYEGCPHYNRLKHEEAEELCPYLLACDTYKLMMEQNRYDEVKKFCYNDYEKCEVYGLWQKGVKVPVDPLKGVFQIEAFWKIAESKNLTTEEAIEYLHHLLSLTRKRLTKIDSIITRGISHNIQKNLLEWRRYILYDLWWIYFFLSWVYERSGKEEAQNYYNKAVSVLFSIMAEKEAFTKHEDLLNATKKFVQKAEAFAKASGFLKEEHPQIKFYTTLAKMISDQYKKHKSFYKFEPDRYNMSRKFLKFYIEQLEKLPDEEIRSLSDKEKDVLLSPLDEVWDLFTDTEIRKNTARLKKRMNLVEESWKALTEAVIEEEARKIEAEMENANEEEKVLLMEKWEERIEERMKEELQEEETKLIIEADSEEEEKSTKRKMRKKLKEKLKEIKERKLEIIIHEGKKLTSRRHPPFTYSMGVKYFRKGKFEEAIEYLEEAFKHGINMADTCLKLALIYWDFGRYDKVDKWFREAQKFPPNPSLKTQAYFEFALIYAHLGEQEEALKYVRRALSIDSELIDIKVIEEKFHWPISRKKALFKPLEKLLEDVRRNYR